MSSTGSILKRKDTQRCYSSILSMIELWMKLSRIVIKCNIVSRIDKIVLKKSCMGSFNKANIYLLRLQGRKKTYSNIYINLDKFIQNPKLLMKSMRK